MRQAISLVFLLYLIICANSFGGPDPELGTVDIKFNRECRFAAGTVSTQLPVDNHLKESQIFYERPFARIYFVVKNSGEQYLILYDTGTKERLGGLSFNIMNNRTASVTLISVAETARKKGIAGILYRRMFSIVGDRGIREVWAGSNSAAMRSNAVVLGRDAAAFATPSAQLNAANKRFLEVIGSGINPTVRFNPGNGAFAPRVFETQHGCVSLVPAQWDSVPGQSEKVPVKWMIKNHHPDGLPLYAGGPCERPSAAMLPPVAPPPPTTATRLRTIVTTPNLGMTAARKIQLVQSAFRQASAAAMIDQARVYSHAELYDIDHEYGTSGLAGKNGYRSAMGDWYTSDDRRVYAHKRRYIADPRVTLPTCGVLDIDDKLAPGKSLKSCDGQYVLSVEKNGEMAVWRKNSDGYYKAKWWAGTEGNSVAHAILQADGNFVVYDHGGSPLWNSETQGNPGAYLSMQNDGNLVVYSRANKALWSAWHGRE